MTDSISRRDSIKKTAAGVAAFTIVPRHVLGKGFRAPSDTLNVACIGVGGMGFNDVKGMAHENIYALCDIDSRNAERAVKMWPQAKRYTDYRELLAKEASSIDVVTISTPDHSHAPATMMALKAGKHVYTQKPLARTVGEVRALKDEAARRPKQMTQMGNQGHAGEGIRQIREIVEAGHIGNVQRVEFWTNRPIWPQAINRPTDMHNVPPTFDWNLWLGPAAERPFHPGYAHFNWRGWWDFGTGAMGDMACHIMDAPFWVLGLRYPTRVIPESTALFAETAPKMSRITYEFPAANGRGPVTLTWRDGSIYPPRPSEYGPDRPWVPDADGGQLWIGDKGTLIAGTYGQDPQLCDPVKQAALAKAMPAKKYPRTEGVYKELTSAIRAGTQPGSNFAGYAGPLTEMIVLGNLAVRSGQTIDLDTTSGALKTTGIPQEWILPTYRSGWTL
ncbi:MAG: Gfo/Idh/MocA family oxidoreductase [Gemmatimonadetes bacterium]|jgi:predicted dehydrogenase|nr:Gfo/Idh/MocA family oxidoreductase [Gemmatimonadota bacterium]HNV73308.1 Gfo/Idh/MocA family oxidoreductase [Gemmatimonadaceae bacterium]MBK6455941.1 Gfo/Idh/MocA family oxidoreductase [Gemmatimonadota bacterium]MBK7832078.1 Gfo/Idh/MocA family oxidoreductase [Gemmatimonadota bacterium]MBK8647865.1 Gfo/Idh/MocA family oxidoreductase [Gemmatimonadota bacterium]